MKTSKSANAPSDRRFGLLFALIFLGAGAWQLYRHGDWRGPVFLAVGAAFLVAAIFAPAVLAPLNKAWMRLGELLNKIVSPLVLGAIFFLLFTPLGFLMRLLGKENLKLLYLPNSRSYWENAREKTGAESFNNQF